MDHSSQTERDRMVYDAIWKREPPGSSPPHGPVVELLDRIELRPGDTFVDLGCGTGRNALFAADRGYRVVAIDHSSRATEQLQAMVAERRLAVEGSQ